VGNRVSKAGLDGILERVWNEGIEMLERKAHLEMEDGELDAALKNFRASVHAWAEAEFARPRMVAARTPKRVWRAAVSWALGCVLMVGAASGVVYEHGRQVAQARAEAAARQAELARVTAEKKAAASEDADALLTKVNNDLARDVPVALDPLAGVSDSADE
jgi:hypothetical protein